MTETAPSAAPFSRRDFLGATAAATAMAATGTAALAGEEKPTTAGRVPGIQLYTVRGSMEDNVPATLTALAAMGYQALEFAGYANTDPAEIRVMLDDLGMTAPSGHVDAREMRQDPMPMVEAGVTMRHEYLTIAWLREEDRQTLDDYRGWAEVLNRAGEACKAAGMRMAYHNHDFELLPIDGVLPMSVLIEETDPDLVDFELDFFWVHKAGMTVPDVLAMAPGRITMAHIKDMDADGNMVDLGAGIIDFKTLLASEAAATIRHPFAEHDNPSDPFRFAAIARRELSGYLGA